MEMEASTNNEDGAASGDLRAKATIVMHEYMEEIQKMKVHNFDHGYL